MNCRELYLQARRRIQEAGVESPGPDALALAERFLGLDRAGLAVHGGEEPAPAREAAFLRGVEERAARRPLQYILGSWDFMGLSLAVGEGVLVPREDTTVLVEALADRLSALPESAALKGVDLCAGTGAVGLGLCSLLPQTEVVCLELSEQAFSYLEQNLKAYPQYHVRGLREDILQAAAAGAFEENSLDFIASNPPYVKTGDISSLQPEVRKEPVLALDGGGDGLIFYRAIAALWLPLLKPGGVLGVEIGEEQAGDVLALFAHYGLEDLEVKQDWAGLDRAVLGRKSL